MRYYFALSGLNIGFGLHIAVQSAFSHGIIKEGGMLLGAIDFAFAGFCIAQGLSQTRRSAP